VLAPETSKANTPRKDPSRARPRKGYNPARMPLPQKPIRRGRRLTIALAVSVAAHLLLLPWIAKDAIFHLPTRVKRQVVSLVGQPRTPNQQMQAGQSGHVASNTPVDPALQPKLPPSPAAIPEPEQKLNGQVVSLGQPADERAPDKPTKYLSEHDSRVLKETRARETSAFFKNALSKVQKEGKNEKARPPAPAQVTPTPGEDGKGGGAEQSRPKQAAELPSHGRRDALHIDPSEHGTIQNRDTSEAIKGDGKRVAMADPGTANRASSVGAGAPGASSGAPGAKGPLKLTLDSPLFDGASGPVAGGPMPDDLRDVDEGNETLLNSRSFKYAGFLNRVKETVGRVWTQKVQDAAGSRDPTGQLYSYKDRRTVIEFTLDRQGEITDVKVATSSGVPYLDSVAVEAFKVVERFPNPPPGLLGGQGEVRLPFAFTLLAATGGMRMQIGPAYLPGSPAARGF
jgi:TonB family protein